MRSAVRSYWAHPIASKDRSGHALASGVTNGIMRRIEQHRAGKVSGFTRKYKVHATRLVPGVRQRHAKPSSARRP